MDNKTKISVIGEAAIILKFLEEDYEVFTSVTGKSPFDLVVFKDNILSKVEVKTTQRRTKYNTGWAIQIKKVRSNRTKNIIHTFDNTATDFLAVYIEPIKKVIIFKSSDIKVKHELVVLDKDLK